MHCWRYIESYGLINTAAEGYSKNFLSCKHSGSMWYIHARDLNYSLHVCVFVLRCAETVRHMSSLLVCDTHIYIWY